MMQELGPTLDLMFKGLKDMAKSEKERLARAASNGDRGASAQLQMLDSNDRSIDAMQQVMQRDISLQQTRFQGGDAAAIGAEKEAKGPAAGLLAAGSSKPQMGTGVDLGLHLEPSVGLGSGSGGRHGAKGDDGFDNTRLKGLEGDPLAGDPLSGDPLAGDPLDGDPLAGDPLDGRGSKLDRRTSLPAAGADETSDTAGEQFSNLSISRAKVL
ncbi:MAG TPA: hypothetical protein VF486_27855 [Actinomycetes bacterium]